MKQRYVQHPWWTAARAAIICALATGLGAVALSAQPATAQGGGVAPTARESLDGRSFQGEIKDEKGVVRFKDVMTFRNGIFRSEKCRELGFDDVPYWTRIEGDTTHFLIESANPEAGKIVLIGKVRGTQGQWSGVWSKERWYWNIRRDISFSGTEFKPIAAP